MQLKAQIMRLRVSMDLRGSLSRAHVPCVGVCWLSRNRNEREDVACSPWYCKEGAGAGVVEVGD